MTNPLHPNRHKRPYLRYNFRVLPEKGQDSFSLLISSDTDRHRNNITILEKVGCRFLSDTSSEKRFQYVLLPAGWKKVAQSGSGYMCLLDTAGRKRIEMYSLDKGGEYKVLVRCVRRF